jgi:hypothetical protein
VSLDKLYELYIYQLLLDMEKNRPI